MFVLIYFHFHISSLWKDSPAKGPSYLFDWCWDGIENGSLRTFRNGNAITLSPSSSGYTEYV